MDFQGLFTRNYAFEMSLNVSEIVRKLGESQAAAGPRLANEIECAGGHNVFLSWLEVLPELVNRLDVEGADVAGSHGRALAPGYVVRFFITVAALAGRVIASVASLDTNSDSADSSKLRQHYFIFMINQINFQVLVSLI
jgi:hypothetical protein